MAQKPPTRNLIAIVFKNFINSFKPRQITGDLQGTDYFGNKYYEIPADPSRGKRKPSRWFVPPDKENFQQEMAAEWESWLRGRRDAPPQEEELMKNLALMELKKRNAIEVQKLSGAMTPLTKGMESFPKRPEYEIIPGKDKD